MDGFLLKVMRWFASIIFCSSKTTVGSLVASSDFETIRGDVTP